MSLLESFGNTGLECGLDEAGRGCLAGPVFAAAVILDPASIPPGLNDSKKLSAQERARLRTAIEGSAIAWAVGQVEASVIDEINILQASILAMHRAVEMLGTTPSQLLVDGNRFNPYKNIPWCTIIGGDACYASIAAASILAKTYRDDFMNTIALQHPQYGWHRNKGYPTQVHIEALRLHGPTTWHRRSFVVKSQVRMDF